ncbi:lysosomal cystine transporter cystinosin isoform X2 [Halictus rubicundus]|uniref:lysosomal cystine transporter cystinosin isoform X2 n=1 Tax=Halictus rubicundus TaxID=77578 RepID=UPI0040373841
MPPIGGIHCTGRTDCHWTSKTAQLIKRADMAPLWCIWIFVLSVAGQTWADLIVSKHDMKVYWNSTESITFSLTKSVSGNATVRIDVQHPDLVSVSPSSFPIGSETEWEIYVKGLNAGHSIVSANITPAEAADISQAFVRVTIEKSDTIYHISNVVGWIYFLAWSVSFYPQIYSNYERKSVVGLNFDYLSLNLVGFIMYALFNSGLFWITEIELEYFSRYPRGLNPVQVNDIFFSLHAVFATVITIIQCFFYERGNQRVSTTARIIHGIFTVFIVISIILAAVNTIAWLDFLYYCSYVKLCITLIKYVPQAFYNYKRKSTVGWSIGNIFLDFTGGILSMLQMILNAYNYDDWESIFGDPTKFGLGFFSVAFDIFFIIQHYVLYRDHKEYIEIPGNNNGEPQEEQPSTSALV